MITDEVRSFTMANNKAVLTTFRRDGAAQMSIVVSTPTEEGVGFCGVPSRKTARQFPIFAVWTIRPANSRIF